MGKILAIDFGLKRMGLALSDETHTFAFGLHTVESKFIEKELIALFKKEKINLIVLGYPKTLKLKDTHVTENVLLFKKRLENLFTTIQIELYDERFTSKMATDSFRLTGLSQKKAKEKALIDEVSAVIILQGFLNLKTNRN
ncbi:MAG: Holliday junction resolvase RuvX [Flavobacteriia bacterium]|nr:Holliday junction resolvase RuvX [Flavobacteriia bacterium]